MDSLSMVGWTHRRTSLRLLEQLTVRSGERGQFLAVLRDAGFPAAVVLSTCSRTEIYTGASAGGSERLQSVLAGHVRRPAAELEAVAETRAGVAVVEHLFRTTAGLDSRVVGEVEIHGQVRSAFREAQSAGMAGSPLNQLFPAALRCSTQVRDETTLGARGRSLGQRAVELGLDAVADVPQPVVIVVGSGRMAAVAVEHLTRLGHRPYVAARDEGHAARLAGPGLVCPLPALRGGIARADLLICATSAAHHVVTFDHVSQAMASRSRPLTVVDLSVPRNVDAQVSAVPGVRLIDLEGMNDDATADLGLVAELKAGGDIVTAAVQRYVDGVAARRAGPVIAALRRAVEETCRLELAKVAPQLAHPDDVARAAHAVAGKLLHRPTVAARAAAAAGDTAALRALGDVFGVSLSDIGPASGTAAPG